MGKIVFTNGCFDLLHPGHVDLLERARALGTRLIVGINSDASVREIKGAPRPFCSEEERKTVLLGLKAVDEVRIFSETTPENLIQKIAPDVLVKGGDWRPEEIIGAEFVLRNGGEVYSLPLKDGFSSTRIAEKIQTAGAGSIEKIIETNLESTFDGQSEIETSFRSFGELIAKLSENCLPQIEKSAALISEARSAQKNIFLIGNIDAKKYETSGKVKTLEESSFDLESSFHILNEGDLLLAFSGGKGVSQITAAIMNARRSNCRTIAVCGREGKKMAALCDVSLIIPSDRVWEIQAAQALLLSFWHDLF